MVGSTHYRNEGILMSAIHAALVADDVLPSTP